MDEVEGGVDIGLQVETREALHNGGDRRPDTGAKAPPNSSKFKQIQANSRLKECSTTSYCTTWHDAYMVRQ